MADISLIRGDSSSIGFEITEDNTPVDLTGSTVFFTVKPALTDDVTDTTAVIAIEVTNHTDPTNGKTSIPLAPTDTNVVPGDYYYDIQIKHQNGTVTSIPARRLTVSADVTRRVA
jgi:hypothetical protein